MAYTQSAPTVRTFTSGGRKGWHITYTEAEVAAASTATIEGLPEFGTITLTRVAPTFTTGTTVRPAFGRTVGFTAASTDINHVGQVTAAAASINDATNLRYSDLVGGKLFVRMVPDGGADTATVVDITIMDGHF